MVSNVFPDSKMAKKYGAGNTVATQNIKDKKNQFLVLKKPNVHRYCAQFVVHRCLIITKHIASENHNHARAQFAHRRSQVNERREYVLF